MSTSERTAAQAKADHIAKMGDEIGAVYSALWQEVAWINKKWAQYVELFGTSPERIDLLNRAAPSMIRTVQDTLWEDVLLHLARLTDPPKSMGKANLSVRHLTALLTSSPINTKAESLAVAALDACEFARDWRNRRLAHRDLDLALGQSVQPLAPASRAAVKASVTALEELLNAVSLHYLDSTTFFDLGPGGEDAVSLLYLLRDGLQFRDDRLARMKRGEHRPDDFKHEAL
jgi:AbiU2